MHGRGDPQTDRAAQGTAGAMDGEEQEEDEPPLRLIFRAGADNADNRPSCPTIRWAGFVRRVRARRTVRPRPRAAGVPGHHA
jgi:hypothetical protein